MKRDDLGWSGCGQVFLTDVWVVSESVRGIDVRFASEDVDVLSFLVWVGGGVSQGWWGVSSSPFLLRVCGSGFGGWVGCGCFFLSSPCLCLVFPTSTSKAKAHFYHY